MKTILVSLAVVLASCTPSYSTFLTNPERWTKPDYDFQRFANDENVCRRQAQSFPSIFPQGRNTESLGILIYPAPIAGMDKRKMRDLYKQCMESKGYVWK
jgi:hypothetical protein